MGGGGGLKSLTERAEIPRSSSVFLGLKRAKDENSKIYSPVLADYGSLVLAFKSLLKQHRVIM